MNVAALASYLLLNSYTPGPNNIMAMTNASKQGFRKAMVFCLGVLVGFFIDMVCCAAFTSLLYHSIPRIESVMKWVGAGYILLLAGIVLRDKPHESRGKHLRPDSFFTGVVMQFINVKVLLYGITALSAFILPHYRSFGALAVAVVALTLVGFSGTLFWAGFGSVFQKWFVAHRRAMNLVMALLLVYCAVTTVAQ